ncbi:FecCD family ABC transporter permease [Brevibacillus centrosporus]|uniref:FecCD family ABC transporter permease n=1 Tax=Brevibacillus centrosporus TaxID=54910 RepID=UPI000F0A901B|nr:iron ABC transporter permease [Brevibacillus centrosporus]MEC2129790.1 iron ABC transporter permease [Brevibacillus centrosporus]MED4907088.1 iron ABC transporter permease [Brevibacillus centrosporus]RNB71740.1 iron ABC transporter permease [Brevibacillus centrosporus]GED31959.1 siderophore ABC transporter permease [Brevibacillus centrosporus]
MRSYIHKTFVKAIGLAIGILLLLLLFVASIAWGTTPISFQTVIESFLHYDGSSDAHVIIQTTRLPRAIYAALIGGNLAVAGALMQALTRNPLASPSIFGINSGAVFFVVLALAFLPVSSMDQLIWVAFFGAGVAALSVYFLGSLGRDGMTPIKIVLAGSAMSALFASFAQGMLVLDESGLQNVLFWLAGSVAGKDLDGLLPVLPYMLAAGILALALGQAVNILSSGEDVAKGLGQKTVLVKMAIAAAVILLAGSSVAVAGSIGFVGLVIPHIARFFVGVDYRWVIPYSAVLGGILLLIADIAARFLIMPSEMPLGVMTALVGAPFFVYTARKEYRAKGAAQ